MEIQNYVRAIVKDEIAKKELIKRVKGTVSAIGNGEVTIQINIPAANISKQINIVHTSGMSVGVGDIVWVYYWKNISDGWILPANMKVESGGVGEYINDAHNSERFNDYTGNSITGTQENNYCSLVGKDNKIVSPDGETATFVNNYLNGYDNLLYTTDEYGWDADKEASYNFMLGYGNKSYAKQFKHNVIIGGNNVVNESIKDDEGSIVQYGTVVGNSNTIEIGNMPSLNRMAIFGNKNTFTMNFQSNEPRGRFASTIYGYGNSINTSGDIAGILMCCINGHFYENYLQDAGTESSQALLGPGPVISYSLNTNAKNIAIAFGKSDFVTAAKINGMELDQGGNLTVLGTISSNSGSDFAEYEEWLDGNKDNEDRCGLFVVENGDYVELADSQTDIKDVLGVVSANPTICGGSYGICWKGTYEKDVFGRILYEEAVQEIKGEQRTVMQPVINPEAYKDKVYNNREHRPEFSPIAYVGKVVMIDDGSCEVGGYCRSADKGIATKSETLTRFKVRKRIDDTHILVRIL